MIVVSDSSPIIYLSWIGRIDLLQKLFHEVFVPPTVYHEVAIAGEALPGSLEISSFEWIKIKVATTSKLPLLASQDLDAGETEAIELALDVQADYLLMDETKGRKIAKDYGLTAVGVLGVLLRAKQKGLLQNIKHEIHRLETETTSWVSKALIKEVLILANEK